MDWQKIKGLKEQRGAKIAEMKTILATAETAKRELSEEETKRFDALNAELPEIGKQIDRLESLRSLDELHTRQMNGGGAPGRDPIDGKNEPQGEHRMIDGFAAKDLAKYSLLRAINARANGRFDGVEKEVSDEIAKRSGKPAQGFYFPTDIPLGYQVREHLDKYDRRTLLNTTTGTGSIATVVDVANFIDLLRNRIAVQAMGARVLSGLSSNVSIPKQTQGGTAYWVAEAVAPTTSNQVIGSVSLAPNTLGCYTDISRKLMIQTSLSAETFVRQDLATIMAIEVDRAACNGSGSGAEPTGILQDSGITTTALATNGAALAWADVVGMETTVAAANADIGSLGYLTNAKVRGKLKTTLRASAAGSDMIWDKDNTINGYRAVATNQIPSNLTKGSASGVCSAAIFGNFNDLILAFFSQVDVLVDPYTGSNTGTVRVNLLQDMDIKFRHKESFVKIVDVLTT